MLTGLRRVNPGEPITADDHNAIVDEIERLRNWSVVPPLALKRMGTGFNLSLLDFGSLRRALVAAVNGGTPGDEAEVTAPDGTILSYDVETIGGDGGVMYKAMVPFIGRPVDDNGRVLCPEIGAECFIALFPDGEGSFVARLILGERAVTKRCGGAGGAGGGGRSA